MCQVCTYSEQIQDIKLIIMLCDYEIQSALQTVKNLIHLPGWLQVVFVLVTRFYWKREEMNVSLVISALPIGMWVKQLLLSVNGQQLLC